jgi:hypothetical protein
VQVDRLLEELRGTEGALDQRLIANDLRRLRSRLDLLRHALIGREPAAQVTAALRNLERARGQLAEAVGRASKAAAKSMDDLGKDLDQAVRLVREHVSAPR